MSESITNKILTNPLMLNQITSSSIIDMVTNNAIIDKIKTMKNLNMVSFIITLIVVLECKNIFIEIIKSLFKTLKENSFYKKITENPFDIFTNIIKKIFVRISNIKLSSREQNYINNDENNPKKYITIELKCTNEIIDSIVNYVKKYGTYVLYDKFGIEMLNITNSNMTKKYGDLEFNIDENIMCRINGDLIVNYNNNKITKFDTTAKNTKEEMQDSDFLKSIGENKLRQLLLYIKTKLYKKIPDFTIEKLRDAFLDDIINFFSKININHNDIIYFLILLILNLKNIKNVFINIENNNIIFSNPFNIVYKCDTEYKLHPRKNHHLWEIQNKSGIIFLPKNPINHNLKIFEDSIISSYHDFSLNTSLNEK